jgi:hypothetical protein
MKDKRKKILDSLDASDEEIKNRFIKLVFHKLNNEQFNKYLMTLSLEDLPDLTKLGRSRQEKEIERIKEMFNLT